METRIAELEASLRRWRVVSVAALVIASFSVLWSAARVLTEPEPPIHSTASEQVNQPGLRRRMPGMRRPGVGGPNAGQRKRRANRPGGPGVPDPAPAQPGEERESPPPKSAPQ